MNDTQIPSPSTSASTLPAVAVVIATRNRPELLRRAIAAIVEQEYAGRIDVLVVFDQTEPDTTLVHQAPDRSVSVMVNDRTPGLPGGRNTGMSHLPDVASMVAFCDDDDAWLPGKVAAQIAYLAAHPATSFCTTGIEIDFEGEQTARPSQVDVLTLDLLLRDRLTEAHPSTFLFRRALIERVGLVDEEIPGGYSEDYDFLLRVARDAPIGCLRDPFVSIRWGRTSYFATRWTTIIDAQRYMLAKHPEFGRDRRAEARIRGQIAFALAAVGRRREALREIGSVISRWPLEKRWPVALVVSTRLVSAERALNWAHATGRGI